MLTVMLLQVLGCAGGNNVSPTFEPYFQRSAYCDRDDGVHDREDEPGLSRQRCPGQTCVRDASGRIDGVLFPQFADRSAGPQVIRRSGEVSVEVWEDFIGDGSDLREDTCGEAVRGNKVRAYVMHPDGPTPPESDGRTLDWARPLYVLIHPVGERGEEFSYGNHLPAQYYFGTQRNRWRYCEQKGWVSAVVYRSNAQTSRPATVDNRWREGRVPDRDVRTLCSDTHSTAFVIEITDPVIATVPRQDFSLALELSGGGKRHLIVHPHDDANFISMTVNF